MNEQGSSTHSATEVEDTPRAQHARASGDAHATTEVLRQLISRERDNLFSEAILARTTAMLADLGQQLVHAYAESAEIDDRSAFAAAHGDALGHALGDSSALLNHCHALAVESVLADTLHRRAAIDPALPPLLKDLLGGEDEIAGAAMHVLAAQSRFLHSARRMELPLGELEPELFHEAIAALLELPIVYDEEGKAAKDRLAESYDDSARRLSQIARLHLLLQDQQREPFSLEEAGLALFAYGLATRTGRSRERIVLALAESDPAQLSDLLRAANWPLAQAQQALAILHPQGVPLPAHSPDEDDD